MRAAVLLLCCACGANPAALPDAGPPDPVVTSFVFVGCNRIQKGDWDPTTDPSSANAPQLQQTFADVAALRPTYFFFTGDLVLGLDTDTTVLAGELDAWAQLWTAGPAASITTLVPLPGNHEMLAKSNGVELANPDADAVWTSWLDANGFARATNGPTGGDDLLHDERELSYSFDAGDTHFVLIDTDSSTVNGDLGWVPLAWLRDDLAAAQANPAITRIFVLGHKPLVAPSGSTAAEDAVNPALAGDVEALLDGTPKVTAYLAAHAHLWDKRALPGARGVPQVIAGNGGSKLDSGATPYYGLTEIRIHESGRVGAVPWRRPVPSPYDAPDTTPATAGDEVTIAP